MMTNQNQTKALSIHQSSLEDLSIEEQAIVTGGKGIIDDAVHYATSSIRSYLTKRIRTVFNPLPTQSS